MPRRAWDNAESAAIKATGWSRLGLKDKASLPAGGRGDMNAGKPAYPPHDDPIKALLGEPRRGQSALDRRRQSAEEKVPLIDWTRMSATRDRGVAWRHDPSNPNRDEASEDG
jgi:hypothetical protein